MVNKSGGTLGTGGGTTSITIGNNFTQTLGSFAPSADLTISGNAVLSAGTLTIGGFNSTFLIFYHIET